MGSSAILGCGDGAGKPQADSILQEEPVPILPGVAQLVERLLWEQEARGSRPCTWTRGVVTSPSFGFNSMGQIARMVSVSLHKGQGSSPPWSVPKFAGVVQRPVHQPSKLRTWVRFPLQGPHPGMAELVDVQDLGSCGLGRVGSTPTPRTRVLL